jgi:hypothetical protein
MLSFPGYQIPSAGLTYILKGTVQQNSTPPTAPTATFELNEFQSSGILVSIFDTSGKPLVADWGFMVEISQIKGGGGAS